MSLAIHWAHTQTARALVTQNMEACRSSNSSSKQRGHFPLFYPWLSQTILFNIQSRYPYQFLIQLLLGIGWINSEENRRRRRISYNILTLNIDIYRRNTGLDNVFPPYIQPFADFFFCSCVRSHCFTCITHIVLFIYLYLRWNRLFTLCQFLFPCLICTLFCRLNTPFLFSCVANVDCSYDWCLYALSTEKWYLKNIVFSIGFLSLWFYWQNRI